MATSLEKRIADLESRQGIGSGAVLVLVKCPHCEADVPLGDVSLCDQHLPIPDGNRLVIRLRFVT
jgi:hypothetical protein